MVIMQLSCWNCVSLCPNSLLTLSIILSNILDLRVIRMNLSFGYLSKYLVLIKIVYPFFDNFSFLIKICISFYIIDTLYLKFFNVRFSLIFHIFFIFSDMISVTHISHSYFKKYFSLFTKFLDCWYQLLKLCEFI